ncbi:MAG TPA: hypothetical protein VF766_07165 [Pyrinomonadaceae bacterium]
MAMHLLYNRYANGRASSRNFEKWRVMKLNLFCGMGNAASPRN